MTTTEITTAPAKAAPAKKGAPAKAAPTPGAKDVAAPAPADTPAKLRWTVGTEYGGGKEQQAVADDRTYAITHVGEKVWNATVTSGTKVTALGEAVGFGKAYGLIVAHNREH